MESESEMQRAEADRALRSVDAIRARAASLPRGHATLQLGYSVMLAAYMALFVYTGSNEGGASVFGGTTMALVLPPMIASTGLVSGAAERHGGRLRATRRHWLAIGVFLALLVGIVVWGIVGEGYPWWLALVSAGLTIVLFGARPLSVLLRESGAAKETADAREPLSAGPRAVTLLLALYFGAVCATLFMPVATWVVMMIGMLGLIVVLSAQTASWGIMRTGWEWAAPQWIAFAVAATVMFLLAVLLIATDLVTPAVAVVAGIIVAAALAASALRPGRGHVAPEA